jgi:hypothetical protein
MICGCVLTLCLSNALHNHFVHPFSIRVAAKIFPVMGTHQSVPDTFTLSGDNISRITQLLRLAQRHARLDQVMVGPHLQDALTELEDALSDHIAGLDNAAQDDLADAEESGAADRERRASYSRYQAA